MMYHSFVIHFKVEKYLHAMIILTTHSYHHKPGKTTFLHFTFHTSIPHRDNSNLHIHILCVYTLIFLILYKLLLYWLSLARRHTSFFFLHMKTHAVPTRRVNYY